MYAKNSIHNENLSYLIIQQILHVQYFDKANVLRGLFRKISLHRIGGETYIL
jgi:hypothetical protein